MLRIDFKQYKNHKNRWLLGASAGPLTPASKKFDFAPVSKILGASMHALLVHTVEPT